jgi:adenylylsulfate kinase
LTVWFTGLSGAGKSTLANAVARRLRKADVLTVLLDEDILRQGFCAGLGSSREDLAECGRRISELARRLSANGAVVLVAATAPYRDTRLAAQNRIGQFIEVYVNAPLATCIERDPKGLYASAIAGEISNHYEAPPSPDIECRTDVESVADCTAVVLTAVRRMRAQ